LTVAPLLVFPDSEELLRVVLGIKVSEVLGSTIPASTMVPNPRPSEFLVVRRIGGSTRDLVTDVPVIQVEGWALLESRADRIAQVARAVLGWLVEVNGRAVWLDDEIVGPVSFPDGSQHARYTASYAVAVRGSEQIALA
jgi:hypothetical protein